MLNGLGVNAIVSRHDQYRAICLAGTSNHVFNEILMARGINDGKVIFISIKTFMSQINGNSPFLFFLQLIHDKSKFEPFLAKLFGFFLKLPHCLLINILGIVKQPAYSGRFTMIYMTNEYQVNMFFCSCHYN